MTDDNVTKSKQYAYFMGYTAITYDIVVVDPDTNEDLPSPCDDPGQPHRSYRHTQGLVFVEKDDFIPGTTFWAQPLNTLPQQQLKINQD